MIRAGDSIENPVTRGRAPRLGGREQQDERRFRRDRDLMSSRTASSGRGARAPGPGGAVRGDSAAPSASRSAARSSSPTRRPPQPFLGHAAQVLDAGDGVAPLVCKMSPALQFESLIETMFSLAADSGRSDPAPTRGDRASPLRHRGLPFPPAIVQRLGLRSGARSAACSATCMLVPRRLRPACPPRPQQPDAARPAHVRVSSSGSCCSQVSGRPILLVRSALSLPWEGRHDVNPPRAAARAL